MEKKGSSLKRIVTAFLLVAALITAAFYYVRYQNIYPSTNDAYVHGQILYIASQVSGQIDSVKIKDYQYVDKGQLIAEIDPALYQAKLDEATAAFQRVSASNKAIGDAITAATAEMKAAEANLADVQDKYKREMDLVKKGVLTKQEGDNVKAALNIAKNKLDAARANISQLIEKQGASGKQAPAVKEAAAVLAQAVINLSYTQIVAPVSGQVGKVSIQNGSVVTAGQALFPLIQSDSFWVQANYKGKDVGKIKPGMKASINLIMYPDMQFIGEVVAISPASGSSFSLLPPENATGNWVQVPQRFPVRINLLGVHNKKTKSLQSLREFKGLRVGSNGSVTIDTRQSFHPKKKAAQKAAKAVKKEEKKQMSASSGAE